jgi:hypothetical protein
MDQLSDAQVHDQRKRDAYLFLERFEKALNSKLPPPSQLRSQVRNKAESQKHLRGPEAAFLNTFVVPTLWEMMSSHDGMNGEKAKESLLNEYRWMRKDYCSGGTSRSEKHPFSKIIGTQPTTIIEQWINSPKPLTGSDPDLATRNPFPFKIVFECKYFDKGLAAAKKELVGSVYQAFLYRGLPYIPPKKGKPAWDYEFACVGR